MDGLLELPGAYRVVRWLSNFSGQLGSACRQVKEVACDGTVDVAREVLVKLYVRRRKKRAGLWLASGVCFRVGGLGKGLVIGLFGDVLGMVAAPIGLNIYSVVSDLFNGGIRNTFDFVPDAPVTKFTLQFQGGKKGLIVNSTNICKGKYRAIVKMRGQNGMVRNFRPVVSNDCKKKKGGKTRSG